MNRTNRKGSTIACGIFAFISIIVSSILGNLIVGLLTFNANQGHTGGEAIATGIAAGFGIVIVAAITIFVIVANLIICIPVLSVSISNIRRANVKTIKVFNVIYVVISAIGILLCLVAFIVIVGNGIGSAAGDSSSSSSTALALFR